MKTKNKFYNPNPLKKENGDCVVRALTKATGKDWETIYKELFELGMELKAMPNDNETWKEYVDREGFIKHSLKVKKGQKRLKVDEFARKFKKGTYLLRVANHLVTCKDGYYYDIWDCGHKAVYNYYEVPEKE